MYDNGVNINKVFPDNFLSATPLKIDVFSVKEFDTSSPLPTERKKEINYLDLILKAGVLLFVLISVLSVLSFPKAKALSFAKNVVFYTPEIKLSLKRLGGSVEEYYQFLLGKSDTSKLLLRVDVDTFVSDLSGVVAGVETRRRTFLGLAYQQSLYFKDLQIALEEKGDFGPEKKDVLGEEVVFNEKFVQLLRNGKELAGKILDDSKAANKKLEEYERFVVKEDLKVDNENIRMILSETKDANEQARAFITEAKKTANYYYTIYDVNIELVPQLISYVELLKRLGSSEDPTVYLSQLDDFQYNLFKLQSKLKRISGDDLPFGLEDLHSDNLKVFDLLIENVREVRSAVATGDYQKFVSSLKKLNVSLKPLYERGVTLEMNFWQNNRVLRKYKDIVSKYEDIESKANSYILRNRNFLVEFLSQLFG